MTTINRHWCALGLSALLLSAAGCSIQRDFDALMPQDDGSGDAGAADGALGRDAEPPSQVDTLITSLRPIALAQCEWMFGCCNQRELNFELAPFIVDTYDCADRFLQHIAVSERWSSPGFGVGYAKRRLPSVLQYVPSVAEAIDDHMVELDEAAIDACAKQLRTAKCASVAPRDHCEPTPLLAKDACDVNKLLRGVRHAGEPCAILDYTLPIGCADGLRCIRATGDRGVCAPLLSSGELCATDSDCEPSLLCDPYTGRCGSGLALNAACAFHDGSHPRPGTEVVRCAPGLACDPSARRCVNASCYVGMACSEDSNCPKGTACIAGQCGKRGKPGEPCETADDCANHLCLSDLPSGGFPAHCGGDLANGEVCNWDLRCASNFCNWTAASGSRCAKPKAVNAACPSERDQECARGKCVFNGTFNGSDFIGMDVGGDGAACATDGDCALDKGFSCFGGVCRAKTLDRGDACAVHEQCSSGACVEGTCVEAGSSGTRCGDEFGYCDIYNYCNTAETGRTAGLCQPLKREGDLCTTGEQCRGACVYAFGEMRCSDSADTTCVGHAK